MTRIEAVTHLVNNGLAYDSMAEYKPRGQARGLKFNVLRCCEWFQIIEFLVFGYPPSPSFSCSYYITAELYLTYLHYVQFSCHFCQSGRKCIDRRMKIYAINFSWLNIEGEELFDLK